MSKLSQRAPYIFCWGAGNIGKEYAKCAWLFGIEISYYVDSSEEIQSETVQVISATGTPREVSIISPNKMFELYSAGDEIIITQLYPTHTVAQLIKMGIENYTTLPISNEAIYPKCNASRFYEALNDERKVVEQVRTKLRDERSREIYQKVIEFRLGECSDLDLINSIYSPNEYFPKDIIKLSEDEVFVDGGGYNGDTSQQFAKIARGKYKHIYTFEPMPIMAGIIRDKLLPNQTVFQYALSVTPGLTRFHVAGEGSRISESGDLEVTAIALDEMDLLPLTFIKLDVESAELEVLIGAKNIIKKYRPKLAVCVYHKLEDLWRIPYYLMENYPFYDLYLRHHSGTLFDTVLYAIPTLL